MSVCSGRSVFRELLQGTICRVGKRKDFTSSSGLQHFAEKRHCRNLSTTGVVCPKNSVFSHTPPVVVTGIGKGFLLGSTYRYSSSSSFGSDSGPFEADTPYPLSRYWKMSAKHLAAGSTCPPVEEGKLRIYSMRFCPYAQRALLVAEAKGVPHDVVNINLKEKPEWIFKLNPMGKVPTFELPQGALYESLVVSDYLDEVYPQRPLHPKDPFRKAEDRILVEEFNKVISAYYKVLFNKTGDTEEIKAGIKKSQDEMAQFERILEKRGTAFFGGSELPGMVDYMIWPWVERLPVLKLLFPGLHDYESFKSEFPKLEAWRQAMKEDPTVKKIFLGPEIHHQFTMSYRNGSPDYDILEK